MAFASYFSEWRGVWEIDLGKGALYLGGDCLIQGSFLSQD